MSLGQLTPRLTLGAPSPLLKQSPTAALFALAVVVSVLMPATAITNLAGFVIGAALVTVATVLAAVLTTNPGWWRFALIVPAIDFLALGALRYGTGGPTSIYVSFVILPVIWFAVEEGRRNVLYATIGTAIALFVPAVVGDHMLGEPAGWMRAILSPIVFGVAAGVANEVSRQSRHRLDSLSRLADERTEMLDESLSQARSLAASEAHLRELESLMRNVWEAVSEQSVIGTSLTGEIDVWNRGATSMLGVTVNPYRDARYMEEFHLGSELDARAANLEFLGTETVANPRFAVLVDGARRGEADAGEWTYVDVEGGQIPVHLSVTTRVNDEGQPMGYLFIARDLTKEREVSRLKDEFVGLISHELRTPLSSILGYLELMRDDDEDELSASQLQYLGVAERNANRLLRLVGDLLFTAQVESGKFQVERKATELGSILQASVESAQPVAATAGVSLQVQVQGEAVVQGDTVRLGQALDNLISNALKFTPRGGSVTLGLAVNGADAVISVADTGIGIPAAELDQLFARFFRATTATRNAVPGVGLGLVITRAIVHAHGGEMSVTSQEGAGTTFSMVLPLRQLTVVPD
ncbi:sensor histidine kinase [Leifsonia sp. Root112D2]|uniref:sensor histidine kinase n=1 Tax=Leifsonia sp. Root112D2 TaxID=1736426 RepID=UPI000700B373|nr:ATP-binding protein [Leifsonia sp. Root112D2]KQV07916.1 hypothetical protein ASC63_12145 [Leifsonia sp. Root112D2]